MISENISTIIESEIPQFLQEEYPQFISFIREYYNWLEAEGTPDAPRTDNFVRVLLDHTANNDVFESSEYIDQKMIGLGFPNSSNLKIPPAHFIAMLRDFYTMRGNADSFKFLFRAFYNQDIDILFPREYLSGASSTRWGRSSQLYATMSDTGSNDFKIIADPANHSSVKIKGVTSGVEVQCERIEFIDMNGERFMKLIISDAFGKFTNREPIKLIFETHSITESLIVCNDLEIANAGLNYQVGDVFEIASADAISLGTYQVAEVYNGSVSSINIISAGTGYVVGDSIIAEQSASGAGFFGEVKAVNGTGGVTACRVSNKGWNYTTLPPLSIKSKTGTGAEIDAVSTTIGKIKKIETIYPTVSREVLQSFTLDPHSSTGSGASFSLVGSPIFTSPIEIAEKSKGLLGGNNIVTDSNYFQQFSYEIKSQVSKDEHSKITYQCHPSGTVQFNRMIVEAGIQLSPYTVAVEITQ